MTADEFRVYMARFERDVVIGGIERQVWSDWHDVTVRSGRLAREPIGKLVGTRFFWEAPAAIDYYGHVKKSTGFMARAADVVSYEIRTIYVPIVFFSKITIEQVAQLAPDLLNGFAAYKADILAARKDE